MIIGEIRRYLRDTNTIRVFKIYGGTQLISADNKRMKLTNQNSKEPTIEQIAKEMELAKEDIVFALRRYMTRITF
jgi:RNA polymerase sporulation-specific sigma factor